MTEVEFATLDAATAAELEAQFLEALDTAQGAWDKFVTGRGYIALGYESFAEWWQERVVPRFRALELKPTRELAAKVIETVREEEQELPPLQRRTQQELADLIGVTQQAISARSSRDKELSRDDLDESSIEDPLPPEIEEQIQQRIEERVKPAQQVWSAEEYELLEKLRAGRTVVVSLRGHHDNLIAWAEQEGRYVRIDRRTEWGNPFEMPADGDRDTVIRNYAVHYLPHKPSLLNKLDTLRGKALACWCAPEPCHGDVLVELIER